MLNVKCTSEAGPYFVKDWMNWFNATFRYFDNVRYAPKLLDNTDVLLTYFMHAGNIKQIKEWKKTHPDLKIVVQLDSDWWWYGNPWLVNNDPKLCEMPEEEQINLVENADLVINHNMDTYNYFKKKDIKNALFISGIGKTNLVNRKCLTFKDRKPLNRALMLAHSMKGFNPKGDLEITKRLNMNVALIGTFQTYDQLAEFFNGYIGSFHGRYDNVADYTDAVNSCLIGMETVYTGSSRFVHECALMEVPCLSSDHALCANFLSPELTVKQGNDDELIKIGEKLIYDEDYYTTMVKLIKERVIDFYSQETSKKRMVDNLERNLGVKFNE